MGNKFDVILDVRNEESPVPMIRTKETLDLMSSGAVLKVITNKESAFKNIKTMIANSAYVLVEHTKEAQDSIFYIQKP